MSLSTFARSGVHSMRSSQVKSGLNMTRCAAALYSTTASKPRHARLQTEKIQERQPFLPGVPKKHDIGRNVTGSDQSSFDHLDRVIGDLSKSPVAAVSPHIPIEELATMAIKSVAGVDNRLDRSIAMVDLDKLRAQYTLWTKRLPNIIPYYAMKCNPDLEIVRCLANLGTNFDCASKNEIQTALSVGADPKRINFAHPIKFRPDLEFAREAGVTMMTFDSVNELHKIKEVYGQGAELLLRLHTDDEDALTPLSIKFGSEGRANWEKLLQTAHDLDMPLKGVSFHVGSGTSKEGGFTAALADAQEVFDMARSKYPSTHGRSMNLLDIGGGFPGESGNADFARITSEITTGVDKMAYLGLDVIGEPGRFFAQQSTTLLTQVLGVTEVAEAVTKKGEGSAKVCYFISDGVYGSFGDIVYYPDTKYAEPIVLSRESEQHKLKVAETGGSSEVPALLFGPTCDGIDQLGTYSLPELRDGDFLLWEDMGAYTQCGVTNFNGISRPKAWYFERKRGRKSA